MSSSYFVKDIIEEQFGRLKLTLREWSLEYYEVCVWYVPLQPTQGIYVDIPLEYRCGLNRDDAAKLYLEWSGLLQKGMWFNVKSEQ
jgi:hypothetical protein